MTDTYFFRFDDGQWNHTFIFPFNIVVLCVSDIFNIRKIKYILEQEMKV